MGGYGQERIGNSFCFGKNSLRRMACRHLSGDGDAFAFQRGCLFTQGLSGLLL